MSHEITNTDGVYLAEKPAWHSLGTMVDKATNSAEAMKIARLNWTVEQLPLVACTADGRRVPVESHVVNVRSDNGHQLGVVGAGWTPLQNHEGFEFLDGLLQDGIMKYETAGSLKGGRVVWMLARINEGEFEAVKGDTVLPYVLLSMAHDGSRAVRVQPTTIRVVCWNTLSMALGERHARMITCRHTTNVKAKLEQARKTLGLVERSIGRFAEASKALAGKQLNADQVRDYFIKVLPIDVNSDKISEGEKDRMRKWYKNLLDIWHGDPTVQMKGVRGTAWGALNTVTRFVDWHFPVRGKDDVARNASRLNTALFGAGDAMKERAMKQALALL